MSATPTATATLQRARDILTSRGWCQNAVARRDGRSTNYSDPYADQFCLLGAVYRASDELHDEIGGGLRKNEEIALSYLKSVTFEQHPGMSFARWNDDLGRTKHEVLKALDRAISMVLPVERKAGIDV